MKRMLLTAALYALCIGQFVAARSLHSAESASPVKITLHPAAEPTPALKYRLLPERLDQKPGNAAVHYGKVTAEERVFFGNREHLERIEAILEMPLDLLRREGFHVPAGGPEAHIQADIRRGTHCRDCDWQLPIGDGPYYGMLLPEVQQIREFARILGAQSRYEVAHGDFDAAVETFQSGFALGGHVAEGETLVNGLVGIACCEIITRQILDYVQQPGAPNLYWALTMLPRPLIEMNDALDVESQGLEHSFPELKDVETVQRTPDEWREVFHRFASDAMKQMSVDRRSDSLAEQAKSRAELDDICEKMLPVAKRALIDGGMPAAQIEAMPTHQVALLYTRAAYHRLFDAATKYYTLPYPDAIVGIEKTIADSQRDDAQMREIVPLARHTLGAVKVTRMAIERNDRQIATLRVIEALRLYAGAHDGQLPKQLSDIIEVPIPDDPVTGLPFEYKLDEGAARLSGPTFREVPLNYEITMARSE
ncbi:MAG TPA: hypothetical protein VGK58_01210 [Lacipirellulaceae bacterium]